LDVYSYGVVSSSTLYRVSGSFPAAEGYAEIEAVLHMTGGEAANSSIVLARLGATVKLDGNWIGDDDSGHRTRALLDGYGIDTTRLPPRKDYRGVQEVVFAAGETRTIFGTYGALLENEDWNAPTEEDITAAKVVCLDPFFAKPAGRVAQVAAGAGVPVVTVDCPYDSPLLEHVASVVIAESFIRENYPERSVDDLFRDYQAATTGLVIFTFGDKPALFGRAGGTVHSLQPFAIDPVDTTGGGDSFRAGIVYGFLAGWDDARMVNFAAAVAAINCTRFPGVLNSPSLSEVGAFIEANPRGDQVPPTGF
jgi:sugar/nucleoside kinase (ribokinase family)